MSLFCTCQPDKSCIIPYRRSNFISLQIFVLCLISVTQDTQPRDFKIDNDFVQKQFGSSCKLIDSEQPMVADMNGDGVEDLVLAARCTNPMADRTEHEFTVLDPYYTFFGYGDPKITTSFIADTP